MVYLLTRLAGDFLLYFINVTAVEFDTFDELLVFFFCPTELVTGVRVFEDFLDCLGVFARILFNFAAHEPEFVGYTLFVELWENVHEFEVVGAKFYDAFVE